MTDSSASQDDFFPRLIQWVLDNQLQYPDGVAIVSTQFSILISQAQQQSREDLHAHIARLVFRKATATSADPPIMLCARLCYSLFLGNVKHGLEQAMKITRIHEYVFNHCVDFVRFDSSANGIDLQGPASGSDAIPPIGHADTSVPRNLDDIPSVKYVSHLVAELYHLGLLSVAHVYEYLRCLITFPATIEDRLSGLCALFEARSSGLDIGPWANDMNSVLKWAADAISECSIAEETRRRVEAIAEAQSRASELQVNESPRSRSGLLDPPISFLQPKSTVAAEHTSAEGSVEKPDSLPPDSLPPFDKEERKEGKAAAKKRKAREAKETADAEQKAKEEEERRAKEEERKAREEEERKAKEEAEAKAKAEIEAAKAKDEGQGPSGLAGTQRARSTSWAAPGVGGGSRDTLVPGRRLGLWSAQGNRSAAPMSALASARMIEDLNAVPYPETIKTPNPDLNVGATPGKFRYDRDFLLQFMNVCKERPDSLLPLDAISLEPREQGASYPSGARSGGRRVGSMDMGGAPMLRFGSVGLGLGPGLAEGGFTMGNFQLPSSRLGDSQSRFGASSARAGIPFPDGTYSRLTPMTRSANQGGVGGGGPRKVKRTLQVGSLDPVTPLKQSKNRWVASSIVQTPQLVEHHQLVERKVKILLNKLTMGNFDSISDQIIEWANKSEQERDGLTLIHVIKLVFEAAKNEAKFGEMYARLCRKMMERVSPNVQDEMIRNFEGQLITGGMLFRKFLLNRCQEDFERGWSAKEAALAAAASKAACDEAAEAVGEANNEAMLYSDEYHAAAKAKRQGLGLVRFIGELFKLQMSTERIMHECIKKLVSNVVNPEEEEIESLCMLLATVGRGLDNPKARNHMDIYFERMQDMAKSSNISSRMQFMLLDVIELRARHWQARSRPSV